MNVIVLISYKKLPFLAIFCYLFEYRSHNIYKGIENIYLNIKNERRRVQPLVGFIEIVASKYKQYEVDCPFCWWPKCHKNSFKNFVNKETNVQISYVGWKEKKKSYFCFFSVIFKFLSPLHIRPFLHDGIKIISTICCD